MYLLEQNSKKPLHVQLYEELKKDIIKNYKVGEKIPSVRKMASSYNLSKTTVENAYSQLVVEGYVESYPKSGYVVQDIKALDFETKKPCLHVKEEKEEWLYDFYPTRLSKDTFPLKLWKRLFSKYIDESLDFGKYSDGQGEYGLREEIAKYLRSSRGVNCHASQVVIGCGFSDSLGLVAKILNKHKHNTLALESPGYFMARDVFESFGYDIKKVGVDTHGLKIDELKKSNAKLAYVTPSHQYPTGVTMPICNRHELLEWAKENDAFIIEDDYDSELSYVNRPIPSLQGLDNSERVIYLGTFSKSLSSALRVSYLVIPTWLVKLYKKEHISKYASIPLMTQKVLEKFMSEGHWEKHLRKIRTLNRKKHNLMKACLKEKLGNTMKIESEGGGLAISINPTVAFDFERLEKLAKEERLKVYFAKDVCNGEWNAIRMGFGGLSESQIPNAVNLFSQIWHKSFN